VATGGFNVFDLTTRPPLQLGHAILLLEQPVNPANSNGRESPGGPGGQVAIIDESDS
jgi:hypothetical protein